MHRRPSKRARPDVEPLEPRRPLSAGAAGATSGAERTAEKAADAKPIAAQAIKPEFGYLVYRRTNPNQFNDVLNPSLIGGHVLVQATQPVPGQVYNVLSITVRNGTAQTFDASSGFQVRLSGQSQWTPILTGNEQWAPGQSFVFYVLTKKYYPIRNQVSGGFTFDLGGAQSVAVPGPSGIFLRLPYNPARINSQLDAIVSYGKGAAGGAAFKTGIVDTSIYEFVSAKTERSDFGGLF